MSISLEERNRRYKAIREWMKENELDSLLIVGRGDYMNRGNIRYITNYGINVGEQYCVFPAEDDPIFITRPTPCLAKVRKAGWINNFNESSSPLEQVRQQLSRFDAGNKIGIIGMELLSAPAYLTLGQFHDKFVNATEIFKQLRLIKSFEEIEKMRVSASIADKAFNIVRDKIRPGVSDYEIYGEVKRVVHGMGCEYSMEFIDAEGAKTNLFNPTGDILEANSTLALEITPCYEGYYTQLPVALPVVEYPRHVREMILVWKEAFEAAVAVLRPGTKTSDVYRIISKVTREHGYSVFLRAGHGIGLDAIDFWSLTESDTIELKSGMTLVLHPNVMLEAEGDGVLMGYTYLITDTGAEKLNKVDVVSCWF